MNKVPTRAKITFSPISKFTMATSDPIHEEVSEFKQITGINDEEPSIVTSDGFSQNNVNILSYYSAKASRSRNSSYVSEASIRPETVDGLSTTSSATATAGAGVRLRNLLLVGESEHGN